MSLSDKLKSTELTQNTSVKMLIVGIVLLLLMIPMSMVSSLVQEREFRKHTVVEEINHKWGEAQTINGPFFTLPYKAWYQDSNQQRKFELRYLHVLPETLQLKGELFPNVRYRSIYEAVLYHTQLNIEGNFVIPDLQQLNIDADDVLWSKARLAVGLSDMRGIRKNIILTIDGQEYNMDPGLPTQDLSLAGVSASVPLQASQKPLSFHLKLDLNGSQQIHFIPLARQTDLTLSSSWSSPSFNGAFLPKSHTISADGFQAHWTVLHLNRNYPQVWSGAQYTVQNSGFGLDLLLPADIYQKSTRLHKYGLIFILFTFTALFLSEVSNRKPLHPIQYILIGLSIILFYTLQLALSEHLGFDWSYIISALATLFLISAYTRAITQNSNFALIVATILLLLYSYLYLVLQLEDYALLMGSVGLAIVLATVMFATRRIDLYHSAQSDKGE